MDKITDVCILAFCWLMASVPLFTSGAATVALFQFTLKQTEDEESYAVRSFCASFARNFKSATALWLLFVSGGAFLALDFYALLFYAVPKPIRIAAFAAAACLAFLYAASFCWAFPLIAYFTIPVRKALHDALILGIRHIGTTLCVFAVYAFFAWASYMRPFASPVLLALSLFVSSYFFRRVFNALSSEVSP